MNLTEMRNIVRRDLKDEDAGNYRWTDDELNRHIAHAVKFPKRYQRFALWGDTVTLLGDEVPDGSNTYIYYGKLHTLDATTSTIPTEHEDLIATGACGHAAIEWAVHAINRVNVGGGITPREFQNWGKEKLRYFEQELKRLGRRNRVRVRSLYKPYYPIVSKSTDYGP